MRSALSALVAIAVAAPAFGAIYEDVTQLKSLNYDYVIVGGNGRSQPLLGTSLIQVA
jgi:hypothetical protein